MRERQQGLAGSGPAADERRPACGQAVASDLVQAANSREGFRQRLAATVMDVGGSIKSHLGLRRTA
jgi:hypothetical protein